MKVTTVIPAHNAAGTIKFTLQSLRNAGCENPIVIANACTDDTAAIAEKRGASVVKHQIKASLLENLNRCLAYNVEGLMHIIPADDTVYQDFYHQLIPHFTNPNIQLVCCVSLLQRAQDNRYLGRTPWKTGLVTVDEFDDMLANGDMPMLGACIFRVTYFVKFEEYFGNYADRVFLSEIARRGTHVYISPVASACYWFHKTNATRETPDFSRLDYIVGSRLVGHRRFAWWKFLFLHGARVEVMKQRGMPAVHCSDFRCVAGRLAAKLHTAWRRFMCLPTRAEELNKYHEA